MGSDNGLLPNGTKPLPEPMLIKHWWSLVTFTWGQFHRKHSVDLSLIWVWENLIQNYSHFSQGPPHWGQVMHIFVSKLTIIGSDNGSSPGWRQTIIWTNDGMLLIRPLGTNFSEILSKIHTFSFKKMHLKTLSAKWRPFCLGLIGLNMPAAFLV